MHTPTDLPRGRVMTVIDGTLAVTAAVGILLLWILFPTVEADKGISYALGIFFLFFVLDVSVIGLLLARLWRGRSFEGGARAVGKFFGLVAVSLGVIFAVVSVFWLTCWGMLKVKGL